MIHLGVHCFFCIESGFCDYEEVSNVDTDHGAFIWNETHVGETDEQGCPFGPEGAKATRYCGHGGWMMYNGEDCTPEATYRLMQLTEVICRKLQLVFVLLGAFYICNHDE